MNDWWWDLADADLRRRLIQRDVPADLADALVGSRDEIIEAHHIDEILGCRPRTEIVDVSGGVL